MFSSESFNGLLFRPLNVSTEAWPYFKVGYFIYVSDEIFKELHYLGRVLMFKFGGMHLGNTRLAMNRLYQGVTFILYVRELY